MRFLRCLRDFEKWSWIEKMRKNEEKWGKKTAPESPFIHYCHPRNIPVKLIQNLTSSFGEENFLRIF